VHVVCHIALGGYFRVMDNEIEQDRLYAYLSQARDRPGFTIIDLRDPEEGTSVMQGAFGVKIRNSDGLIIISDSNTGFWAFRMDGFNGWNGNDWGMPNISAAQDWDHGPPGAGPTHTAGRSP